VTICGRGHLSWKFDIVLCMSLRLGLIADPSRQSGNASRLGQAAAPPAAGSRKGPNKVSIVKMFYAIQVYPQNCGNANAMTMRKVKDDL
jgi:hypothetical protein